MERSSGEERSKKRKRRDNYDGQVDELVLKIKESPQNYNAIKILLKLARHEDNVDSKGEDKATFALCGIFCRLFADGKLGKPNKVLGPDADESVVSNWLRERYNTYRDVLLARLNNPKHAPISLDILLLLVAEESSDTKHPFDWKNGLFSRILNRLLQVGEPVAGSICPHFATSLPKLSAQARIQTFAQLAQALGQQKDSRTVVQNALTILFSPQLNRKAEPLQETAASEIPGRASSERKHAQQAWLAVLSSDLQKNQRKKVLTKMTSQILPWFQHVEVLMDFLTDSFDQGGATSLLALEGLFFLMRGKNLDYPDFYVKLYSLLDDNLLHSKHRSRFFRLLETFMSSTHLPAAMVASFIKRLSRLSLYGPPAGVVAVIPWVYNMLKTHPTCTFMIHREPRAEEVRKEIEEEGFEDPFSMNEMDPMETNAIESSLWEIETLQSHYHPNVASLAKIISEQFTKRSYNLEDFLDHSYGSLLASELGKPLKKTPVVEFQIPKSVFKDDLGDDHLEVLLSEAIAAS